jgi:large subunit ribosomal protein L3
MKETGISSIVAFKAGMTHVMMTDDSEGPSKGVEISRPCTILEVPNMEVYGIRLYSKNPNTHYRVSTLEVVNSNSAKKLHIKKIKNDEKSVESIKAKLGEFVDATALVAAYPKGMSAEQHHPVRFEAYVGGKSIEEKFSFLSGVLGKELKASDVFKNGEYVDVAAISKGKGWQGPVKRLHVAVQFHKATGKTRHVGALGAFGSGKVFYTVPQAGQLGFNYRTEHNKKILKVGTKGDQGITPTAGFSNYGIVRNDYLMVSGSVPGPAKILVRIRKPADNRNAKGIKEPKITYIAR